MKPALLGLGLVEAVACGVVYVSWERRQAASTDAGLASAPVAVASHPPPQAATRAQVDDAAKSEEGGVVNGETGPSGESPACAALSAHNEALLAKLERADAGDGCAFDRPDVNCVTTPNGVSWGYRLVKSHAVDESPDPTRRDGFGCHTTSGLDLVRIDTSGERGTRHQLSLDHQWYNNSDKYRIQSLADYDGDGEFEILLSHDARQHEGGPVHSARVLTYREGALDRYPHAEEIAIDHAEDVDGDGRPDLIARGPYANVHFVDSFGNDWPVGPAIFVFRSEADGTFRLGGPVSIAYAKTRCASQPPELRLVLDDFTDADAAGLRIVCARLWGAPAAQTERAWDRLCLGREGNTDPFTCQQWPKELATIVPPLDLRPGGR